MTRLKVRCCCQPQKILGTLEVPNHKAKTFKLVTMTSKALHPLNQIEAPSTVEHRIEIRDFYKFGLELERAIYSDDRPIEFWRQFTSFRESEKS